VRDCAGAGAGAKRSLTRNEPNPIKSVFLGHFISK
jgi:hypothetical protein